MKLYKDKNIEFRYDVGGDVLIVKFLQPQPIMYEAAQFTGAIEVIPAKRILLDLRIVEELIDEAKNHLLEDLTLQLLRHGIRKMAIVRSPKQEVNELMEQILLHNLPPKLKFKFYDNYEEALAWLKNNFSKD